jgi:class 3 adenylate cyclase
MITFDLIASSKVHGLKFEGKDVRSIILKEFSQLVIRNGGWRESHSGDSAYAHFGLLPGLQNASAAAYAVASEFRVLLRNLCLRGNFEIESGIGLHFAKDVDIFLHTAKIETSSGIVIQKSFDSSCSHVDLVHRIEKVVHLLPGSNIVMTKEFLDTLPSSVAGLVEVGSVQLKGQPVPSLLFLKASDKVNEDRIIEFKNELSQLEVKKVA